jgi:hypothetical protein
MKHRDALLQKAKALGPCGGSDTLKKVAAVCAQLDKASPLDRGNAALAMLALAEALVGESHVGTVLADLDARRARP